MGWTTIERVTSVRHSICFRLSARHGGQWANGQMTTAKSGDPAFLTLDARIPAPVRELMVEADGCLTNGFLTGGTVCAQRAAEALLRYEKAEGATYAERVQALGEKHPVFAKLLLSVLVQLGDTGSRESAKLTANTLRLLVVTLKAMLHELYVVGPERSERLQYVRHLLESTDRKGSSQTTAAAAVTTPESAGRSAPAAATA
jgi:hypothetical protein